MLKLAAFGTDPIEFNERQYFNRNAEDSPMRQSLAPPYLLTQSGRGGTPPLPHHEACRLLALRGFRNSAPFVQRVLGFFSRRIRFGTLRPYLGTPLRRLLSPSFDGLPLCFSCPSSVRSKSLNGLRIQPFAALWRLLWLLLTSPRPYASLL